MTDPFGGRPPVPRPHPVGTPSPPEKPPDNPVSPPTPPPVISPPPSVGAAVSANDPYRELGNTTRDAFKQAMLRTVGGAVPFSAELDAMYDALAAKGVTRLAVPMSWMECKNSTYPTCGVPQHSRNPWSVTGSGDAGSNGRWASYSSYAKAAQAWADLVTEGSPYKSATSIKDFIHIYAPGSDNNNEAQYVRVIVDGVNALPLAGGTTPAPPQPAPVPIDPIRVIVGGDYPPITYGFLSDVGINSYAFVVGHGGTRSTQHSGDDVGVPHGTPLFTPLPGRVICVGNAGQVLWGEGCGFYTDDMYGGTGNITILFDDMDLKMTLGHCHTATVGVGQHVAAGQQVGTSGGSNGDHVHVETATIKNGSYWLLDPIPALRTAMGGVAPVTYADPVDVPQPDDAPPYVIVRAIRTTPVLQRANPSAPPIFEPLTAGTTFHAQERVIGADGKWWWVGRLRGRVAEADTEVVQVVTR